MRIFTAAVIKGGVGKTTACAVLSQAAAHDGRKVLAIDLDPQGNFSLWLAANQNKPGSYSLLSGSPAADLIQKTEQGIDCIAASADLAAIRTTPGSAKRLQRALEPIKGDYDFCFIDTAPSMGELQNNALHAATDLIIPLEADSNSLQGLYQIVDIAQHIKQSNPGLTITGVILSRYDGRPKINKYLRDVIEEKAQAAGIPFLKAIRQGIAVKEAAAMQQSLYEYAPQSKPAADYMELYRMITKQGANNGKEKL